MPSGKIILLEVSLKECRGWRELGVVNPVGCIVFRREKLLGETLADEDTRPNIEATPVYPALGLDVSLASPFYSRLSSK